MAKRKAREKQKKRELKAAGIDVRQQRRKRKRIDYNAEISFEKRPPPGLMEQSQFPTTIEELEIRKQTKLILLPPQIFDQELDEIAREWHPSSLSAVEVEVEGSSTFAIAFGFAPFFENFEEVRLNLRRTSSNLTKFFETLVCDQNGSIVFSSSQSNFTYMPAEVRCLMTLKDFIAHAPLVSIT
ncbi:hypothetical protein Ahy_B08g092386 [Arachis hypogaea]|uniref:Uncharacterized protein n=1 Tax=Arachis hypogaea TaxID=3818 RepID=A0A444Y3P5_ARAHY|nr:hypothetical protein Ahy_B08g092386 [Arachis hypogaea]